MGVGVRAERRVRDFLAVVRRGGVFSGGVVGDVREVRVVWRDL